mmetsp:Transcript_1454/g.2383  ORF Transcript_1454/g.2383 Transcript_1454/m.2383 type:complete len:268 (-) Transcript_1454:108-911(-)
MRSIMTNRFLPCSQYSIATAVVLFFGYIIQTAVIQYIFYTKSDPRDDASGWKIQFAKKDSIGKFFTVPVLSSKPNRGPYHRVFTLANLLMVSFVGFMTTECSIRGWNYMRIGPLHLEDIPVISCEVIFAMMYQQFVEYYWHRAMHSKLFYARFHKYHHFYKSPEPFDDLYIHPLEAFGYYCILWGPPFLFSMHYVGFIAYMIVLGICGVLDHSGIRVSIPAVYNTEDHDSHHFKFEVNYAFPFPYMDLLHGTFDGEFLGHRYKARRH